jgi:hypothetical protein
LIISVNLPFIATRCLSLSSCLAYSSVSFFDSGIFVMIQNSATPPDLRDLCDSLGFHQRRWFKPFFLSVKWMRELQRMMQNADTQIQPVIPV